MPVFLGKPGAAAMEAYPQVAERLDEILAEQRDGLSTPASRLEFDAQSRRQRALWAEKMGQHYDTQTQAWAEGTNNTHIALNQNAVANNLDNPAGLYAAWDGLRGAYVKNAQLKGEDPDGALLKADQVFYTTQIDAALGRQDTTRANVALAEGRQYLASATLGYDQLVDRVNRATVQADMDPAVDAEHDAILADAAKGAATAGGPPGAHGGYLGALHGQEGTAKNPLSSAAGTDQFTGRLDACHGVGHGTWFDVIKGDPQFASAIAGKTDAQILAMRADPQLDDQAALSLGRKNVAVLQAQGILITDANVGTLHWWGSADGPKILQADPNTPMTAIVGEHKAQINRVANQTAGDVVATEQRRFGTGQFGGAGGGTPGATSDVADTLRTNETAYLDKARADFEKRWPTNPDNIVDRSVDALQRRIDTTIHQRDEQYLADTHTVERAVAASNAKSFADIRAQGPDASAALDRMEMENPFAYDALQRRFDTNSNGKAEFYGTNFSSYLSRALAPSADPNRISNPAQPTSPSLRRKRRGSDQ